MKWTVWSKLDLYKSFHQLPQPKKVHYLLYSLGVTLVHHIVMGLTNALEIPQRTIYMVPSGLHAVKWIHADITN